jgi:hypothetical protein
LFRGGKLNWLGLMKRMNLILLAKRSAHVGLWNVIRGRDLVVRDTCESNRSGKERDLIGPKSHASRDGTGSLTGEQRLKRSPTRRDDRERDGLRMNTVDNTGLTHAINWTALSGPFRRRGMRSSRVGHDPTSSGNPDVGGRND